MATSGFMRDIQRWVAGAALEEHDRRVPYKESESGLLLGTLVFGRYVERFLRYCVRSLGTRGNLRALRRRPTIMIHTDQKSLPKLKKGLMSLHGTANIMLLPIAENLATVHREHRDNRYILLGATELIGMKHAFFQGMHYHCLFPDVVYSENYFRNLERLSLVGHRVILTHSLNASLEDCGPLLKGELSAKRLASLALLHMHPRQQSFVVNGRMNGESVPSVPHLVYVSRDRVSIMGMHAAAAFLHNSVLGFPGLRLNATLDAQIPYYVSEDVPLYMPQIADDMTIIELSDEKWTRNLRRTECPLREFAIRFWVIAQGERGFGRVFDLTTEFPINALGPWSPMEQSEVESSMQGIRGYVSRLYPDVIHAFDHLGGVIEESGVHGPLTLPQDRIKEAALAARSAA